MLDNGLRLLYTHNANLRKLDFGQGGAFRFWGEAVRAATEVRRSRTYIKGGSTDGGMPKVV